MTFKIPYKFVPLITSLSVHAIDSCSKSWYLLEKKGARAWYPHSCSKI